MSQCRCFSSAIAAIVIAHSGFIFSPISVNICGCSRNRHRRPLRSLSRQRIGLMRVPSDTCERRSRRPSVPLTKSSATKIDHRRKSIKSGKRAVTYRTLFRVLENLGYERLTVKGSHVVFSHPKANAKLILPWRAASETVDASRLSGVYQLVSSGGIATRQEVDEALTG
jgi:predicted RNA binding protein YcfA (HicA-like mRNA interferase family)